jgi:hypothetical protein
LLLLLPALGISRRQHQSVQAGRQPLLQHHSQRTARCRSWPAHSSCIICNSTVDQGLQDTQIARTMQLMQYSHI